ncbi:molybdopterin synthase sulfur carrier subunit [Pseudohongiella nitratireducens]|uniref:Molybdopterin synthase sulfur carrier subunit n=1 Tax=Pseudohongiella nitratireducens TaxID=1768907 RepID=A0A917GKS4_9GAMM|nr:molybdopterin converting factor subunit 1 [Pseudohongiella nitratireducens]GGG49351.1 molybdopterin synthase sulfur carrier subunit [Pseudohongiella nitratireducens]
MLTVRYFASLREALGCEEENITLEQKDNVTVSDLVGLLSARGEPWDVLQDTGQVLVAVNQSICQRTQPLHGDEEVAFFPPMTGG